MVNEKISFNVKPEVKESLTYLAHSRGKNLSVFLNEICQMLIESNQATIALMKERAKDPLVYKFDEGTKQTRKKGNIGG